jgi:aspartate aminotransferase
MNHLFSQKVLDVVESSTVKLAQEFNDLKKKGEDIVSLIIGEPDIPVPASVKAATIDAINANLTTYSEVPGLPVLREKIAQSLAVTKEEIFVANGSKQILNLLFQAFLNPGDEVIIPRPFWVTYPESIKLASGVPVIVDCNLKDYTTSLANLSAVYRPGKTKAILLNFPNNPSGSVLKDSALREILEFAKKNDVVLLIDLAYEDLLFDTENTPDYNAIYKAYPENIVLIKTFSKSFSMTGYRIGYSVAHKALTQALTKLQSHICGNVCTFAQHGAIKAIEDAPRLNPERKALYQSRRDLAFRLGAEIFPGLQKPAGGLFIFPEVSAFLNKRPDITNDSELASYLLHVGKVAIVPGSAFGLPNYLRISFATTEEKLVQGLERMGKALAQL